jgi:hypothetical protein
MSASRAIVGSDSRSASEERGQDEGLIGEAADPTLANHTHLQQPAGDVPLTRTQILESFLRARVDTARLDRLDKHILESSSLGLDTVEKETAYRQLFKDATDHFKSDRAGTIADYINNLVLLDDTKWSTLFHVEASIDNTTDPTRQDRTTERKDIAETRVFAILGTWLNLSYLFRRADGRGIRPILLDPQANTRERNLDITLAKLLDTTPCLPRGGGHDLLRDAKIGEKMEGDSLNIWTLRSYAEIEIKWINNLSNHLMRRPGSNVVEIFGQPELLCAVDPFDRTHMSMQYREEVRSSYRLLFPLDRYVVHSSRVSRLVRLRSWCLCQSCKTRRLIEKHKGRFGQDSDRILALLPQAGEQQSRAPKAWTADRFPILWSRIVKLKEFQAEAKPAKFWQMWRDRRNPVQYYGTMSVWQTRSFTTRIRPVATAG